MSLNINCSEINPAYTFSLTISLCSLVCHWWLFLLFHCACGEGKRRICDRVWQVLLNAKWNRVKERYWRSVIYSFVMIRFIFIQVAFKINWSTFFFFSPKVLTLHNILIPAVHSVLPVKTDKGQGHRYDSQLQRMSSDLSLLLCLLFPFAELKTHIDTQPHMCKAHRERFTLSLKINDTSNVADGCNQKFKQAAWLSLSLFLGSDCQGKLQQCALCKAKLVCFIILSPFNL